MPKLKVYGVTLCNVRTVDGAFIKNARVIVAAPNQKVAASAVRVSKFFLANYGSETGNAQEVSVAMAKPGTAFAAPDNFPRVEFKEYKPK